MMSFCPGCVRSNVVQRGNRKNIKTMSARTLKPHGGTIIKLIIDSVTIIYQPATEKHIYVIPSAMTGAQLKEWKLLYCDWSM